MAPSPTAVAHRLVEPERTSPAANTPGALVSSRPARPALSPVRTNPCSSRATTSPSHSVQGDAPRNRNRKETGTRSPSLNVTASSCPSFPWSSTTSHADPNDDARLIELVDQIVRHRLAQVAAAVEERDERPAPREPDGGLTGRVASTDNADA